MEVIHSITVECFRGISNLKIDLSEGGPPLINVIVGRNGTCKSSLLEAIGLAASAPSFTDIVEADLLEWIAKRRGEPYADNLDHLVRRGSKVARVRLAVGKEGRSIESLVEVYRSKEALPKEVEGEASKLDEEVKRLVSSALSAVKGLLEQVEQAALIPKVRFEIPSVSLPSTEEQVLYVLSRGDGKWRLARLSVVLRGHFHVLPSTFDRLLSEGRSLNLLVLDSLYGFGLRIYAKLHDLLVRRRGDVLDRVGRNSAYRG